jgi:hypothetical protein
MKQGIPPSTIEVVDDSLADALKSKSPAERISIVAAANRTARILAEAGARFQHPDWDDSQIQAEVARRVAGGSD